MNERELYKKYTCLAIKKKISFFKTRGKKTFSLKDSALDKLARLYIKSSLIFKKVDSSQLFLD